MADRSMSTGSTGSSGKTQETPRQSSQTSLFEQLASQAKDLVRESTRQSSQERLLAQMDKVNKFILIQFNDSNNVSLFYLQVSITSSRKDFRRGSANQRRRILQSVINVGTIYSSSSSGSRGGQSKRSRSVENVERSLRRYHSRQ